MKPTFKPLGYLFVYGPPQAVIALKVVDEIANRGYEK